MFKHGTILLVLSIIVVIWTKELDSVVNFLNVAHNAVSSLSSQVFAGGTVGRIVHNTLALFLIPIVVAGIPALLYWAFTRKYFTYFHHILWACWLILATTIVTHH